MFEFLKKLVTKSKTAKKKVKPTAAPKKPKVSLPKRLSLLAPKN